MSVQQLFSQADGILYAVHVISNRRRNYDKRRNHKTRNLVYKKPTLMNDNPMHYCPGCSHGVVHKLIAEVIEEMGMEDKTIGVSPVGCAVLHTTI